MNPMLNTDFNFAFAAVFHNFSWVIWLLFIILRK
jgi:hypothetical protein